MTVRDAILSAIVDALAPLAAEVEMEPAGDPSEFPALGVTDAGHSPLEHETDATRREMTVVVDGFVDGAGGAAPTAERNALAASVVAAVLAIGDIGGSVELIEDGDLRLFTATLSSMRRLGFAQDFTVQFTTSRADPALPA